MSSSSPQTTTRTTGEDRAHREARDRGAARTVAQRPPTPHEPYLDGLFTYCLSVLCDHDAATAALADALVLAERRRQRCPEAADERRAWLYALARWACLRRLTEIRRDGKAGQDTRDAQDAQDAQAAREGRAGQEGQDAHAATAGTPGARAVPEDVQAHRRRELALLAWPEAAGTTPEQREALELAVRHHLAAHEVAAVLGTDPAAARELLASAACEVERTRAALAVVGTGACPGVARFAARAGRPALSAALRRELVRHVDDCPRCRRTAERAIPGRWPGTSVTPAELPVLTAPRAALHRATAHPSRARGAVPRFDRRGFPMPPGDRTARRGRLRARAVATGVAAAVVAVPAFALWATGRDAPSTGIGDGRAAGASETRGTGSDGTAVSGEHSSADGTGPGTFTGPAGGLSVSVRVSDAADGQGAARMEVTAARSGTTTLVTLTATGRSPVRWSATTGAPWLYLNRSSGTLDPGATTTIKVDVDHQREPAGHWSARVAVEPGGAVVLIDGYGTTRGAGRPGPRPGASGTPDTPPPADPRPSATAPAPAEPAASATPTPADPDPTPPADPSPTGTSDPQDPPGDDATPSPAAP